MNIAAYEFEYAETGHFSQLVTDYLGDKPSLHPFYQYPPQFGQFRHIMEAIGQKSYDRETLAQVFGQQYNGLDASELCRQNMAALRQPNTFVVVTGHQTNLFAGPLYFLYKIASTINLAERLQAAHPQSHFVPVYWMGSEDHDFAEINHVHLFGKKLEWEQTEGGATGRLSTQSLKPVLEQLKNMLGGSENAGKLAGMLEKAYLGQPTLAAATRFLVNELFGKYGLLVLDQDDARLKILFSPIMEAELLRPQSPLLVGQTNQALEKAGYPPQAHVRGINLFYLSNGKRERIVRLESGGFGLANGSATFTKGEMLAELRDHPERISPNVILRPLYQQCVLPALAYIGGGGELAYWMQLQSLFGHYEVHYPMLLLRNSVLWINAANSKKMRESGLQVRDLFAGTEKLVADFVQSNSGNELTLGEEKARLDAIFAGILSKSLAIDPSLEGSVAAEASKLQKSVEKLESKLLRAEKRKFDTAANRIRSVKQRLFPDGGLQERHDNFMPYYLEYGDDFIATLKAQLHPMRQKFLVLEDAQ